MKANPFSLEREPSWLSVEAPSMIRDHLRKAIERNPLLSEQAPSISGNRAVSEVTAFFSEVTFPLAEMIEALYTSQLLREESTVVEIIRRMAEAVKKPPLPPEVVLCMCATFIRLPVWSTMAITRLTKITWRLGEHHSTIPLRSAQGVTLPVILLVTEEPSGKVLAFRCLQSAPTSEELALTLYDALVYPHLGQPSLRPQLHTPARLLVQGLLSEEMRQVAQAWRMEIIEDEQVSCPFLRQWEAELAGRALDADHYHRIFDRACERAFGYAPFLQKQLRARWMGWHSRLEHDPAWSIAGLRALLPRFEAQVGQDGILEWQGLHYRDQEADILSYWAGETVVIRPSPLAEAVIWVYWPISVILTKKYDVPYNSTYMVQWSLLLRNLRQGMKGS
jgi:Mu transposase, C-terminal